MGKEIKPKQEFNLEKEPYKKTFFNALVNFCKEGGLFVDDMDALNKLGRLGKDEKEIVLKLKDKTAIWLGGSESGIELPSPIKQHLEECFSSKVRVKEIIFTQYGADVEIYPFDDNKKGCNEIKFSRYNESELFVNNNHEKGREARQLKSDVMEGFAQLLADNCRPTDQYFEAIIYQRRDWRF